MRSPIVTLALFAAMLTAAPAHAQWTAGNEWLGITYHFMSDGKLYDDDAGGVIAVAHFTGHGNFWQPVRVSPSGAAVAGWPLQPIDDPSTAAALALAPDGAGGLLHCLHEFAAPYDVQLERYAGNGAYSGPWNVAASAANEIMPSVAADGSGGSYIGFVNGFGSTSPRLMHLLAAGTPAPGWPVNGKAVASNSGAIYTPSVLAADGAGGVLVLWAGDAVCVQRVNADGTLPAGWVATGLPLSDFVGSPSADLDSPMQLLASDATHWIAGWVAPDHSVLLSRFGADGNPDAAWPGPVVAVPSAYGASGISYVSDGQGGVWVLTSTTVQHVLSSGQYAPGFGPNPIGPFDAGAIQRTGSKLVGAAGANGGIIVFWDDVRPGGAALRARWLLADGTPDPGEPATPRVVVTSTPWTGDPNDSLPEMHVQAALGDGSGSAYVLWDAHREYAGSYSNPTMTHLVPSSALSVPPPDRAALLTLVASPNPCREAVTLRCSLPDDRPARVALLDLAGRLVRAQDLADAGPHTVRWNESGALAPGIYLARIEHAGVIRTTRVAIVR